MPVARFIVGGKVQGVFFRAGTREQALRLGLRGHAINLANGDVDVLAAGDVAALDQLESWLRQGPAQAHVTTLVREDLVHATAQAVPAGFSIS